MLESDSLGVSLGHGSRKRLGRRVVGEPRTRWLPMCPDPERSSEELREEDRALASACLRGDAGSLEVLASRLTCVPRILASINHRMGGPLGEEDLADLSQDTLIVIWGKLGSFEGRGRLETWAYRFCFLEFMNRLRRTERRQRVVGASLESLDSVPSPIEPSVREFEVLEVGLAELGSPEADVIRMKHFDGWTFDDIAARLGQAPSTVKSQYYRGLDWLKRRLEPVMRKEERR